MEEWQVSILAVTALQCDSSREDNENVDFNSILYIIYILYIV